MTHSYTSCRKEPDMTLTRQLRDAVPTDPEDHGPVAVPSDAIRAVTGPHAQRVALGALGVSLLAGYALGRRSTR